MCKEIELFPFPRVYTSLEEVIGEEIVKYTGARLAQAIIHSSSSFSFEDREDPLNPYMNSVLCLVDPQSEVDMFTHEEGGIIYCVDEDESNHRLVVVASNELDGLEVIRRALRASDLNSRY